MFRALTVAGECGAGGGTIAQRVAEMLGWKLMDRALIGAVARAAQVDAETAARYDESVDSWWHRFNRKGLWSAAVEGGFAPADVEFFDGETIAAFAHEAIAKAAERGNCVIVGRGAQCVLRGRDDVLHVFIYGPWGERASRIGSRVKFTGDARELIRLTDLQRARYIRTYYGCDWKDPLLYQMMISSQVGVDNAAGMIVDAVRQGGNHLLGRLSA